MGLVDHERAMLFWPQWCFHRAGNHLIKLTTVLNRGASTSMYDALLFSSIAMQGLQTRHGEPVVSDGLSQLSDFAKRQLAGLHAAPELPFCGQE